MTPLSYKNTCGTCLLGSGHVPITMRFSDVFGSEIACIGQYMKTHTVFKLLVVAWHWPNESAPAFEPSLHSLSLHPHVWASYRQCESRSIGISIGISIGSSIESIRKRRYNSSSVEPNQGRQGRGCNRERPQPRKILRLSRLIDKDTVKVGQDVGAFGL